MEVDELILIVEKNKNSLSKIDDNFYDKIRKKIEELERLKKCSYEKDAERFEDEIRTIQRYARKVFELRTSKIISAAWAEVCGQQVGGDLENMTSVEKEFFKKLVDLIKTFKEEVFGVTKEKNYVLVRIKKSVEIQGVDGKRYKLRKEDVVTLPKQNADALIKADVAEKIEVDL